MTLNIKLRDIAKALETKQAPILCGSCGESMDAHAPNCDNDGPAIPASAPKARK